MVIPNFWDATTVQKLRDEIHSIVTSADLSVVNSVFSTKEQERSTDDYFLTSGREIRYFWEGRARDENGVLINSLEESINKIGHGLHDLNPEFERVTYEPRVGQICRDLGMEKPLAAQSMYIFKQARVGGEVGAHQDGAFLYTEPQSVLGFWWALDECTLDNGCLWAVPGSHHLGVTRRYRRSDPPSAGGVEFVPLEPVVWSLEGAVPVVVDKGALVLIHSSVVHYSADNRSPVARHAYTLHAIEGKEGVNYPADNWLQRPSEFPFREIVN